MWWNHAKFASSLVRLASGLLGVAIVVAFARFALPGLLSPVSRQMERGVEERVRAVFEPVGDGIRVFAFVGLASTGRAPLVPPAGCHRSSTPWTHTTAAAGR